MMGERAGVDRCAAWDEGKDRIREESAGIWVAE